MFHANGNQKKAGIAIIISDKIDFKIKTVRKGKEVHNIRDQYHNKLTTKGSIKEDITIINIFSLNIGTPQYIWQMLRTIKGDSTVTQ